MDQDDDPVVTTLPLLLSTRLAPYLHLVHNPPATDPEDGCSAFKCRIKPKHGWLWLETAADPHHLTVDRQRAADFARAAAGHKAVGGLTVDMAAVRAFVGDVEGPVQDQFVMVRTDEAVVLTPIQGRVDIRPSLLGVDLVAAERAQATTTASASTKKDTDPSTEQRIMPTFQKRETEEQQQARLSSYDHLHKVWEEEPWTGATYFPAHLEEAVGISARLVDTACTGPDTIQTHGTATFMRNMGIIKPDDTEDCNGE